MSTLPNTATSQRSVAMALALVAAIVLSPLYLTRRKHDEARFSFYETRLLSSSGFVLPMVVAGLVIAIKTTSSGKAVGVVTSSQDPALVMRVGGSSWGLAGILVMLLFVISWQGAVQEFFWR